MRGSISSVCVCVFVCVCVRARARVCVRACLQLAGLVEVLHHDDVLLHRLDRLRIISYHAYHINSRYMYYIYKYT